VEQAVSKIQKKEELPALNQFFEQTLPATSQAGLFMRIQP
jgi:hypothetical protein